VTLLDLIYKLIIFRIFIALSRNFIRNTSQALLNLFTLALFAINPLLPLSVKLLDFCFPLNALLPLPCVPLFFGHRHLSASLIKITDHSSCRQAVPCSRNGP
jgi:hypothetical protein